MDTLAAKAFNKIYDMEACLIYYLFLWVKINYYL